MYFTGEHERQITEVFHFLILFKEFIPFSLYIIIDLIRLFQGKFIEWDIKLYDENKNLNSSVRGNVTEDLGKIEYILTDKTGTLTKS